MVALVDLAVECVLAFLEDAYEPVLRWPLLSLILRPFALFRRTLGPLTLMCLRWVWFIPRNECDAWTKVTAATFEAHLIVFFETALHGEVTLRNEEAARGMRRPLALGVFTVALVSVLPRASTAMSICCRAGEIPVVDIHASFCATVWAIAITGCLLRRYIFPLDGRHMPRNYWSQSISLYILCAMTADLVYWPALRCLAMIR